MEEGKSISDWKGVWIHVKMTDLPTGGEKLDKMKATVAAHAGELLPRRFMQHSPSRRRRYGRWRISGRVGKNRSDAAGRRNNLGTASIWYDRTGQNRAITRRSPQSSYISDRPCKPRIVCRRVCHSWPHVLPSKMSSSGRPFRFYLISRWTVPARAPVQVNL